MAFLDIILGGVSTIFGGVSAAQQANEQRRLYDQQIQRQYEYDTAVYNYQWDETNRDYEYILETNKIRRAEEETIGRLKDQMSLDEYRYNLSIRDFDYLNSLRQYAESENIYRKQLGFNQMAAQQAVNSENRKFQETVMSNAFEHQDMMIEMLQQEGLLQARGVSGRSAGRAIQSALAQYGRNKAVLAESLVSAEKQTNQNLDKIAQDRYGADLAAEANRMLMPEKAPDPVIPYKTPRANIVDPRKPERGPAPIKGTNTAVGASPLGIVAAGFGGASQIASAFRKK